MTKPGRLWAVGFEEMDRAAQVRELGTERCLIVLDTAMAVCYPDGIVTLNGEPFLCNVTRPPNTLASFIAAVAPGIPPLTEAGAGALVRSRSAASDSGIDENFVSEVGGLLKPGTSALFVLDQEGDMDALLRGIRDLGQTVLKTAVDLERAKLIQATRVVQRARSSLPPSLLFPSQVI